MRLTLVAGVLVGLSVAAQLAPAEVNGPKPETTVKISKAVDEQLRRFRAGADERQLDHGDARFSRLSHMRGVELLAQSFEVDRDFYRAAVPVGGLDELGPIFEINTPAPGDLRADSPWVSLERRSDLGLEKQTVAIAFRRVRELGRGDELRMVRVQRDYFLAGFGGGVRVRAGGRDEVTGLHVETNQGSGVFSGFDLMLGKILSFRATPTHLYVYTSAYVGYELAINAVDGQLIFTPGRQLGDVSAQLKAQAQKISNGVTIVAKCDTDLVGAGATP